MSLFEKVRGVTGTTLGCIAMLIWFIAGMACTIFTLWVLWDTYGAWTIIIGIFLAPFTYILSFFIVWFATGTFPALLLIPYGISIVAIILVFIGSKIKGDDDLF